MLVDIHAHMDYDDFQDDLDEVLQRAKDNRVTTIISNGTNIESNRNVLALAKKHPMIKPALGFYPLEILKVKEEEFQEELDFIKKNKDEIIAIGEVGIDRYIDPNTFEKQKLNFQKIIELTEKVKKPIISHSRKAEADIIDMLNSSKVKHKILHCFSGSKKLIKKAIEDNFYFSIPTNVVYADHFKMMADLVPISQLFLETDAPYLAPVKGQRNEPKNILYTLKEIAKIKKLDEKETEKLLYQNYQKVFQ